MYMLRLISAVLHRARGPAVRDDGARPAPGELGIVVPLVAAPARALGLAGGGLRALVPDRSTAAEHGGERSDPTRRTVDWLALSPTLALLGAAGVALLGACSCPRWLRRAFAAFVALAGFVTAGVLRRRSCSTERRGATLIAESITRDRLGALAAILVAGAGALAVLVSWGERRARPRRRVLRAARRRRRGHGLLRQAGEPDDALPRPRVVLDLALHPLRDRHATARRRSRRG